MLIGGIGVTSDASRIRGSPRGLLLQQRRGGIHVVVDRIDGTAIWQGRSVSVVPWRVVECVEVVGCALAKVV